VVAVSKDIVQRRLTLAGYQALPDDADDADDEIVDGVLFVAPRPRPRHQVVAKQLAHLLTSSPNARSVSSLACRTTESRMPKPAQGESTCLTSTDTTSSALYLVLKTHCSGRHSSLACRSLSGGSSPEPRHRR
jgi:hypothetical protein